MKNVIEGGKNTTSEEIGRNGKPFNFVDNRATDDVKPEDIDSPGMEKVSHDEEQRFGEKVCDPKIKELFNVEKVHDIAMMWSTVLPKYQNQLARDCPSENKEDHASVVQLDPGGVMASVLKVEKLFKKGASAGIQQSSYSWGLTCPPALSATPRPRRSTRYKYITAMLVKVTKLENKAHAAPGMCGSIRILWLLILSTRLR